MLVSVHERWGVPQRCLESVELGMNLVSENITVEPVRASQRHKPRQSVPRRPQQRRFGQVEVQADVHAFGIKAPQKRGSFAPSGRSNQSAHRLQTPQIGQALGGGVDAGMQAEVVEADANHRALAMLLPHSLFLPSMRSTLWFIVVGCSAAAVHWAVVVLTVESMGWPPLAANLVGWLVAVAVSFAGHFRLSFRGHGVPVRISAPRFLAVSATGFAINEASYALLLHVSDQRYEMLLAAVLVGVAAFTYWASRHWAFLRTLPPS